MLNFKEIIIVDNRSTDDTVSVAMRTIKEHGEKQKFKVLKNSENYGLGGSHKVAFSYATANDFDFVCVLHGDGQGKLEDFRQELECLSDSSVDCILGSRFMSSSTLRGYSYVRIFGNLVFNLIFSLLLRKFITDLGAGLNVFRVKSIQRLNTHLLPDDLLFNYALTIHMALNNLNTKFVAISWSEKDQISNVKLVRHTFSLLVIILQFVFRGRKYLDFDGRDIPRVEYTSKAISS